LTRRALEILAIPKGKGKLILDIGCGSGISGSTLGAAGHMWIGTDISQAMLEVASEREIEGDVLHSDMGHGFGFRPGMFDGAVSISAIQWLCSAEKSCQNPYKRLQKFFQSLYACLVKGARCAFQFYPSSPEQAEMITTAALKNGFTGGLIVDFPNSKKAKKFFLFLMAGYSEEI
jgi:18S rRNA (guanine1575-N7)-methyltransferase